MPQMPRDRAFDSTLALMSDGYCFISKRCRRYQSDLFQTRLMLQPTICMLGEEAARLFYDASRFQRHGAAPVRMKKTLLGESGVQTLDGEAHRRRKQMFMSLMTPESVKRLADLTFDQWRSYSEKWERMSRVVLFDEVNEMLCRAVCRWAEVPLKEEEVGKRTRDLVALIEGPGTAGPRHWRGRWGRRTTERWLGDLIDAVRRRELVPSEASALYTIAWHRELDGKLLDKKVAAVELINLLRPTVAISRFVIFAALALHEHPECRQNLLPGEDGYDEVFVQEVRRFYPFFPTAVARVRETFEWSGYRFPKGTRALLDLYGTNHDARLWEEPEAFRPERFRQWNGGAFNFIAQGGSDHYSDHRCAGEWITIELMKVSLRALTTLIAYDVPAQNLRVSLSRMPALPKSRFVIANVRRIEARL
ncbi:MAG: cytochrome P450 [Blastocatellia bacterium]